MDLGKGLGHLTYSTLVHPADDWPQLWDSLQKYLPQVKKRVSPNQPFGVCIRLSHLTAATLSSQKAEREKLKAFLKDHDLYIYTANAFVYGVFKLVAHLVTIEQETGKLLTLGIDPEPRCYLETTDETVRYFQDYLYTGKAAQRVAQLAKIPMDTAISALRRHLGVTFDIGHQAVGFEDIPVSLQKLVDAGIPIVKLQEAASMYIGEVTDEKIAALQRFTTTIYLSQTAECRGDHLEHYLNLEDAMARWQTDKTPRQWRTHFHVPVFLEDLGPMKSTRFALEQALAMHKKTPLSRHLEIETYTWDVLPDHLKTGDIVDYVCREIEWVRGQLA